MSVIGPRPNLPTVPFNELSELEQRRLAVRPGITGCLYLYYNFVYISFVLLAAG